MDKVEGFGRDLRRFYADFEQDEHGWVWLIVAAAAIVFALLI